MASKKDITKIIGNKINQKLSFQFDKIIEKKQKSIQRRVDNLQKRFFLELIQKTVGVRSAPDLGQYSPPAWKSLKGSYLERRNRRKIYGGQFYTFTGGLKQSLRQSKATTSFGRPIVSLTTPRGQGKPKTTPGFIDASGKVVLKKVTKLVKVISVNLYPRVTENLKDNSINEGRYFSDKIAVKLTNFRGNSDRPIITHYMNWWLRVKAKQTVEQGLKS